jgi:glutamate carboxypeptidase
VVAAADLALRLSALVRPGLSVNCARIEGGGPNNVVPDHAVLRVNMRPSPRRMKPCGAGTGQHHRAGGIRA